MILFDFRSASECLLWHPVNDVVMGGVSQSRFEWAGDSIAVFEGVVSLENSGGFASVRSTPSIYDLRRYAGIQLRVRSDGKRYKINLKTESGFDGIQYQATFEPGYPDWSEIIIPFSDFVPVFRGKQRNDAEPLDTGNIRSFGFLISGGQEGHFRLEIDWIAAYA